MSGTILLVVHQTASDPGRVARQLRAQGYGLEIRRPFAGDKLPRDMDDHAGAVVFGGTMSANNDSLNFIRAELNWIPSAVESGKPFLGICLGAQLLARALGAEISAHPTGRHEIGFTRILPTTSGNAVFDGPLNVYQWHAEGFTLPSGAQLLASGETFENQAFRYGQAVGVQFHPEATAKIIAQWTQRSPDHLSLPGAQPLAAHVAGVRWHNPRIIRWLRGFLKDWVAPVEAL